MKPTVYIETSFVSYLTARPSRDLVLAANQRLTSDWWRNDRQRFDLYTSGLVLTEAAVGDATAALNASTSLAAFRNWTRLQRQRRLLVCCCATPFFPLLLPAMRFTRRSPRSMALIIC